ncbi:hypothetical protein [Treponema sp. SP13]|uniref:hypothetical protein n=1 Tax=Treponema sp. SP13 TaxID=2789742 RepID=UPI003D8E999B
MNKVLIDTNILYSLSGIDDKDDNVDYEVLRNEFKKYKNICISELSLFELYTHLGFDEGKRNLVKDYICKNSISIVQSFPDISSFIKATDGKNLENEKTKKKITDLKINLEAQTLRSCIVIIAYIFYYFMFLSIGENSKELFSFQVNCLLESNSGFLLNECKNLLSDFYTNGIKPKDRIHELITPILYNVFINYELSMQNLLVSEVIDNTKQYVENTSIPLFELKEGIFRSDNGILCKKDLYWSNLNKSINFIKDFFIKNYPSEKNYINYYCCYARAFLTQGKKFDKNNLFDSLFHFHDDNYTVFTLDTFLTETYKNESHYSTLIDLQNKIKKNV